MKFQLEQLTKLDLAMGVLVLHPSGLMTRFYLQGRNEQGVRDSRRKPNQPSMEEAQRKPVCTGHVVGDLGCHVTADTVISLLGLAVQLFLTLSTPCHCGKEICRSGPLVQQLGKVHKQIDLQCSFPLCKMGCFSLSPGDHEGQLERHRLVVEHHVWDGDFAQFPFKTDVSPPRFAFCTLLHLLQRAWPGHCSVTHLRAVPELHSYCCNFPLYLHCFY